ncbi:MAG: mechanosensitive ion channel family protein [Acidimicrobiia bacterium]
MLAAIGGSVFLGSAGQLDPELVDACGASPGILCEFVFELTDNETVAEVIDVVVAKPVKIIFIFLLALVVNRLVRRSIQRLVERLMQQREEKSKERERTEVDDGRFAALKQRAVAKAQQLSEQSNRAKQRAEALGTVLRSIGSIVIYSIAAIVALAEFNINLGPLVAGAGIVGVAVGFGAQSLVRDFISGIFMLVEDQYGVGDVIDVGGTAGLVEEVNLRTTKLRDVNGTVWFIPNGEVRLVGNKSQQWARSVLDIEVAYDTDIDHAIRVIKEVADGVWRDQLENATVLEEPQIWGVERFGDSAIAIRLVLKVEPNEQWATGREVRKRLKEAFDAEGIEIPFPQRTVWIHQVEGAEAAATAASPSEGEAG